MGAPLSIAGRYTVSDPEEDLLGRGGMGEVYRATDTQTADLVAIKALNPEIVRRNPDLLERFQREGEALRQLNHPNIVRFITAVEENGCHYLVMEYVPGGSLEDLLARQGRLDPQKTVEIALDLADGLTRAHRLSILHRDLKPANVLLAEDGTPRLADFGIAYQPDVERLTQTGVLVGTVDYLSPEVCQGEPPDERSDIWSFGVLLFQVLAGRLPFEGKNLTAKITAILTQPLPDISQYAPGIPDALADLVYRMLEKDPQLRIPSIRQVGLELESILKGRSGLQLPGRESRFVTPARSDIPKHNLPVQPSLFLGRETELCELARLLADPTVRLVTIVGLGGMGKTRLAIEAGTRQLESFSHGVFFVSLAGLETVEAILPATAHALGFSFYEGREPRQQLLDYLHQKKVLLVFDNFEHLLGGVNLVEDILHSTKDVLLLCTSRVRLGLPEEHLFHLEGMDFPDWETPADALLYSAVQLFLQSARRVRPGFELAADDLKYVARICRLVGGMPLGILLAASWLELLPLVEIASEIQHGIDFLATDLPGIPERQRSVRTILDHSWNSLSEQERAVFRGLSVFRGGFSREAAQAVTGSGLRELMGLVNKSLLSRTPAGRYDVHELLRQYGAEKLALAPEDERVIRDRHCAFYADFLHQRETGLFGKNQRWVLAEIGAEIDNLRAGWEWAVARCSTEWIDHYLECLGELYQKSGWYQEGNALLEKATRSLSAAQEDAAGNMTKQVLAKVLLRQGRLNAGFDTSENTDKLYEASINIFRSLGAQRQMAYALCYWGGCENAYGRTNEAPFHESECIFQELNDRRGLALVYRGLGWVTLHQGDYPQARRRFEQSLALFREIEDHMEVTRSLRGLGYVSWIQGHYQESRQHHEETLSLCRELGYQGGIARSLGDLGIDSIGLGEYVKTQQLMKESLAAFEEIGDIQGMADEVGDLGELANAMGDYESAAGFAQEGYALWARVYIQPEGWTKRVLGNAECSLGKLQDARHHLFEALDLEVARKRKGHILLTLVGVARLLAAEGNKRRALELLGLVLHHPASWQWAKIQASPVMAQLEADLSPEEVSAHLERGRMLDLDTVAAELLLEMRGNDD